MKFTHSELGDLHEVATLRDGYYNILLGDDTAVGPAMMGGAHGAIGSTYQVPFMIPIYKGLVNSFNSHNVESTRQFQARGTEVCRIYSKPGRNIPNLRHMLTLCGYQVGKARLPFLPLSKEEEASLEKELRDSNFNWS